MEIKQNTLYLTQSGVYVSRDHLNLKVEVERETRLSVPIHHLESVCIFGQSSFSPPALQLCWEYGVPVNYFSENGYLLGRWEAVPNTSVTLRRAQYRAADDPRKSASIARQCVAGKLQNSRQSLLRSARESGNEIESARLKRCADQVSRLLEKLHRGAIRLDNNPHGNEDVNGAHHENGIDDFPGNTEENDNFDKAGGIRPDWQPVDRIRGYEGQAASLYFEVFSLHLRQQREDFTFTTRTRRPARDAINSLLSFLYALLRHDCIVAMTATGLDPFVGYLHAERPNRPALALDLMEEFRPMLADRLAITLINRKQVTIEDFAVRDGGVVELTPTGRKAVITAWQTRKQETVRHPLLDQEFRIGQLMLVQARILARHLRGDLPEYLPCVLR